jgi:hypothetical protein
MGNWATTTKKCLAVSQMHSNGQHRYYVCCSSFHAKTGRQSSLRPHAHVIWEFKGGSSKPVFIMKWKVRLLLSCVSSQMITYPNSFLCLLRNILGDGSAAQWLWSLSSELWVFLPSNKQTQTQKHTHTHTHTEVNQETFWIWCWGLAI